MINITTEYTSDGANNNYHTFICELKELVNFKIAIQDKDKVAISMIDSASGMIDISATITKEDLDAVIRVLRNVSIEMQKLNVGNTNNPCMRNFVTG